MKDLILRAIPDDVRKIILKKQWREKELRGTNQFSMPSTIYKIIREWEECINIMREKK